MNTATFLNVDGIPEFAHLHGTPVTILDVLSDMNNPDHISGTDASSLPLFSIRFEATGVLNQAFPDEIAEEEWTGPMKAVIAGMQAFSEPTRTNPYDAATSPELHQRFQHGLALAEFKAKL